jgi:hypothetical protein
MIVFFLIDCLLYNLFNKACANLGLAEKLATKAEKRKPEGNN